MPNRTPANHAQDDWLNEFEEQVGVKRDAQAAVGGDGNISSGSGAIKAERDVDTNTIDSASVDGTGTSQAAAASWGQLPAARPSEGSVQERSSKLGSPGQVSRITG